MSTSNLRPDVESARIETHIGEPVGGWYGTVGNPDYRRPIGPRRVSVEIDVTFVGEEAARTFETQVRELLHREP